MSRHFGLTSGTAPGAQPRSRSPRADTPREYVNKFFPSGSILAEPSATSPSLESRDVSDALRDVFEPGSFLLVALIFFGPPLLVAAVVFSYLRWMV